MAINANHPFEELNGIRCAVVEKNCSKERVEFLTYILEGNDFEVVVVPSPPPKAAPAPKPAAAPAPPVEASGNAPVTTVVATPATAPAPTGETAGPSTEASAPKPETPTQPAAEVAPPPPPAPETFTVGVTDVTFNVINAIYGRLLRSPDGRVVTMAYWQQKEDVSRDDIPYYLSQR